MNCARQGPSKALMLPYLCWKSLPCSIPGESFASFPAASHWWFHDPHVLCWDDANIVGFGTASWLLGPSAGPGHIPDLRWDGIWMCTWGLFLLPVHSFHGTKCRNTGQKGGSVQYILDRPPVQLISEQNLGEVCSLYHLFRHRHIKHIFFYIFSQVFRMVSTLPSWSHLTSAFFVRPSCMTQNILSLLFLQSSKIHISFHLIYLSPGHLPLWYLWPSLFWVFLKNHLLKLFSLLLRRHFAPHFG